jgi:NhaA family Na+:H+ antiporter
MSIFITLLAFDDAAIIDHSKIAILVASLVAGCLGFFFLKASLKKITLPLLKVLRKLSFN